MHKIDVILFIKENHVLEQSKMFKLDKMISDVYLQLPKQLVKIKDLYDLKKSLMNLINKLLVKILV
jgi:hypothetical protein